MIFFLFLIIVRKYIDYEFSQCRHQDFAYSGQRGAKRKMKRVKPTGVLWAPPPNVGEILEKCLKISIKKLNFKKEIYNFNLVFK